MTKKAKKAQTLRLAIFFCIIVFGLILLSLLIKVIMLVHASHFDGNHQYILQVVESSGKSDVVIFNPEEQEIHIVVVSGDKAKAPAFRTINIPVDAQITVATNNENTGISFLRHSLSENLWGRKGISVFDTLRLLLFSSTIGMSHVDTQLIDLPVTTNADAKLTQLAKDKDIFSEGLNVAVVNASGVSGVGSNVARILSHIGVNVISVTTAPKDQSLSTLVYTDKKSYTLSRISNIFGLSASMSTHENIADIVVTIGEDKGNSLTNL